jgi:TolA-binding protein
MLSIKQSVFIFIFACLSHYGLMAQNVQYSHPLNDVFQKGMQALRQGDSLTAFQHFQSAYTFDSKQDDVSYQYISLSLALEKKYSASLAKEWIATTSNRIYISRISFLLGNYYFKNHKEAEALKSFSNVSIDDLENQEIFLMKYEQGYLYFKQGNWDKATVLLNGLRQVKNNTYYTDANYYAGFIALEKKDYHLALNCFQIASSNKNYASLTPFYISQLYYFLGDIDAAMANCEKALKNNGQYYYIQLQQLMGHLLFEKKQYTKALPYLASYAAAQTKLDEQDLYQLSFCYTQTQQWDKAIVGFKQLANVEDSLGQNSMYLLGTAYLKMNDKNGAKNAFLLCSTKSQNLSQKEISLFNYAKLTIELKEYSNAVAALDKFTYAYPNSEYLSEAKTLWITALTMSNNYVQALEAYESIEKPTIELLKLYPQIILGRATVYINDGQIEKAYTLLVQLQNTPYNAKVLPETFFWLGELAYKMGRINESIDNLDKYLADGVEVGDVSVKHAKYTLGYCYLKKANYQKAMEYFSGATFKAPSNAFENYQKDAFVRLADCQMMLKQLKPALQSYQQIIDLSWSYIDYATLQKAIILGGMGQTNDKLKILKDFDNNFTNSMYTNDARMELADTYTNHENYQEAIAPLTKVLLDKSAKTYYPQAYYKLGLVYFNLDKNEVALQTFRELFSTYPKSIETDNSIEFVRNIFIENQTPELFVQFMNDFGKPLSTNEQDSLTFRANILKYEQKKYTDAATGFAKYLIQFPNGKYQLDANNIIAEIAYAQQQFDTAALYFGHVADQAPNKFAERAALIAARLNYFNFKQFDLAEKYFTILDQVAIQQENKTEALKGMLRCQYKREKWAESAKIATQIIQEKTSASDDLLMANMALYHNSIINNDTAGAIQLLNKILKSSSTLITAEAHYQLANIYLSQNKLALAEKTAFEIIKKQASYEYWVTKTYILLGDIYVAQKDNFNAIATYKSVAENASIDELKAEAANKLKLLVDNTNIK